jgi:hypothetical protein
MGEHAKLMSPSSAARRIACPGSHVLEAMCPDTVGDAARDGTAMHEVAALCLQSALGSVEPHAFIGRFFDVDGEKVEFTEEMADLVKTYVDAIRGFAKGNDLYIETRVDFSRFVQAEGCFGTADAIVLAPADGGTELQVHDLKTGFHRVRAEGNPQLLLYALGAYDLHSMTNDIVQVRAFIHQPKVSDEPDSWSCSVDELLAFAEEAYKATHACKAAEQCHIAEGVSDRFAAEYLNPGDDQCRFCKAAATCPAANLSVQEAVGADFEVIETCGEAGIVANLPTTPDGLSAAMAAAPLVEVWLKAVRAETERRLLAGQVVPGFKLVQGKKGPRKWADPEAAEAQLKKMRLKVEEMYQLKVISPTTAEKHTKAKGEDKPLLGPRQWQTLQGLITQSPGSPSVAPADDPRPALTVTPPADDFEVVQDQPVALEALL